MQIAAKITTREPKHCKWQEKLPPHGPSIANSNKNWPPGGASIANSSKNRQEGRWSRPAGRDHGPFSLTPYSTLAPRVLETQCPTPLWWVLKVGGGVPSTPVTPSPGGGGPKIANTSKNCHQRAQALQIAEKIATRRTKHYK